MVTEKSGFNGGEVVGFLDWEAIALQAAFRDSGWSWGRFQSS